MKDREVVFIVGAGRSGTTWLHLMLGAHPAVATGQESQLFEKYLRRLDDQWNKELQYPQTEDLRQHGITSYVDEGQFAGLMRDFAIGVFGNILAAKPGARLFLEKSPNNSFNVDLMVKCFPGARFIHLIRDGRDVVSSMIAAKKGWGRQWAPDCAEDAAREWVRAVTECRRLGQLAEAYTEVRYEDLLGNGAVELGRLFGFLELQPTTEEVAQIYERFSFTKLKSGDYERDVFQNTGVATASGTTGRPEPQGFFRKGTAGTWRQELTSGQIAEVNWVAGPTLVELGYADDRAVLGSMPVVVRLRGYRRALKTWLRKAGSRLLS